jgi:hypothetical protein
MCSAEDDGTLLGGGEGDEHVWLEEGGGPVSGRACLYVPTYHGDIQ